MGAVCGRRLDRRFHIGLLDLTRNADKLLENTAGRRGRDYFEASYRLDLERPRRDSVESARHCWRFSSVSCGGSA